MASRSTQLVVIPLEASLMGMLTELADGLSLSLHYENQVLARAVFIEPRTRLARGQTTHLFLGHR